MSADYMQVRKGEAGEGNKWRERQQGTGGEGGGGAECLPADQI